MRTQTRPTIVELRPGEGGDDAARFADELATTIVTYLRRTGSDATVDTPGRTITIRIAGDPGAACNLAGTHRIQRIPGNDRRGRRHTSTVTIAVLDHDPEGANQPPALPDHEVDVEFFSGSGAGGQHRNRHPLCCRARHRPTGIETVATRHRSRNRNRADALAELARRVHAEQEARNHARRNQKRRLQVAADRSAKTWTWNDQRGEVRSHATGQVLPMKELMRGRLERIRP